MKSFNHKTRGEQLFLVLILFGTLFCVLCLTGCGGKACEKPACESFKRDGYDITGCSVPGCGGCLSSGSGCDSACWPQATKCVSGSVEEGQEKTRLLGCDTRYYGDGCLGCGQEEKTSYLIYTDVKGGAGSGCGWVYGSTDSDERFVGCSDGEFSCSGTDGSGSQGMAAWEFALGID